MSRVKEFNLHPLRRLKATWVKVPNGGANPKILKGLESGPDELLKTKGGNKKDVKNEDRSGWFIENKGAKKVVWMS